MNLLEAKLAAARERQIATEVRRNSIAIVREPLSGSAGAQTQKIELNLNDIETRAKLSAGFASDIEREPRATVLAMLSAKKLDENYSFKVAPGEAENYMQAMRQVLSRTRKKAKTRKMPLEEFKLLRVNVEETPTADIVTLVRTQTLDAHQKSVYDDIMNAFAAVKKDDAK